MFARLTRCQVSSGWRVCGAETAADQTPAETGIIWGICILTKGISKTNFSKEDEIEDSFAKKSGSLLPKGISAADHEGSGKNTAQGVVPGRTDHHIFLFLLGVTNPTSLFSSQSSLVPEPLDPQVRKDTLPEPVFTSSHFRPAPEAAKWRSPCCQRKWEPGCIIALLLSAV